MAKHSVEAFQVHHQQLGQEAVVLLGDHVTATILYDQAIFLREMVGGVCDSRK